MAVARNYAVGEKASILMVIQMGLADRAASLKPFSQYPHEEEVCFPAVTAFEVVDSKPEKDSDTVVLEMRPAVSGPRRGTATGN